MGCLQWLNEGVFVVMGVWVGGFGDGCARGRFDGMMRGLKGMGS